MLTCLQLKMKSKTEQPYLMYRQFEKIKVLLLLFSANQLLVEFICILKAFHQPTYKTG